jgi:TolB-like protein/class 3 adenylate cyclase
MSQTRRLAAILAADVAGYSRLMGADEEGTLERLKALRRELVDPKIAEHRGRIVKTTGDGLLVEFSSVVDAVRCAVAVQQAMPERDTGVAADNRIELRIGINLGDVIVEGDDLYGDGVNIAARIEALADPGGVFVSNTVHDHVRDRLPFVFEDLGEQQVKNIARPLRVYRVRDGTAAQAPSQPAPALPLPLPDKPSIAVLPFQNMSGDPEQEYFADGMVEEIITALSRIRWLFVIARNSSFTYKGQAVDVKQVGRELGVRYVLEGSVRKAGGRVRITAQLIDTANARHAWAERYDRALDDIFALQDELTISVIGAIEPTLRQAEIERARRKRPDSLDAYDLYLRALPFAYTSMPEDAEKALPLLERAIAIEPDYAVAHAIISWCREQRYLRGGLDEQDKAIALHHARLAIASGGDDATALAIAGLVVGFLDPRDYESALDAFGRSLTLSPSSALALILSAVTRAWRGDSAIAIEQAELGLRLSPFDPLRNTGYMAIAIAHFVAGLERPGGICPVSRLIPRVGCGSLVLQLTPIQTIQPLGLAATHVFSRELTDCTPNDSIDRIIDLVDHTGQRVMRSFMNNIAKSHICRRLGPAFISTRRLSSLVMHFFRHRLDLAGIRFEIDRHVDAVLGHVLFDLRVLRLADPTLDLSHMRFFRHRLDAISILP